MRLCIFTITFILPFLCTFWHAIPTSLFIFNDFSFLYTYVHKVNGDTVNYSGDVPLNWDIQWNPSITDTLGTENFVRYNEVSLSQGLPVYFR